MFAFVKKSAWRDLLWYDGKVPFHKIKNALLGLSRNESFIFELLIYYILI